MWEVFFFSFCLFCLLFLHQNDFIIIADIGSNIYFEYVI